MLVALVLLGCRPTPSAGGIDAEPLGFSRPRCSRAAAACLPKIPPTGDDGWTALTPSPDSQVVYVSPTGNDATCAPTVATGDPFHPASPTACHTLDRALDLVRDGWPDWVLLEQGGVWETGGPVYVPSGRSEVEPFVLSSYGEGERPLLVFPDGDDGLGGASVSHTAIVDLHLARLTPFTDITYGTGLWFFAGCSDLLLEGNLVEGFTIGISVADAGMRIRRNVVHGSHTTGVFVDHAVGALFEENVVTWTGELLTHQGSGISPHGFYFGNDAPGTSYVLRGNLVADTGYSALDLRQDGGVVEDNLIVRAQAGIDLGGGPEWALTPALQIEARDNVILDGRDPFVAGPDAYAIRWAQGEDVLVANNVIANASDPGFAVWTNLEDAHVNRGTRFEGNLVTGWAGDLVWFQPNGTLEDFSIEGNTLVQQADDRSLVGTFAALTGAIHSADNTFWSEAPMGSWFLLEASLSFEGYQAAVGDEGSVAADPGFADPAGVTLAAYDANLGGEGSHEHFLSLARAQRKGSWDDAYTAAAANDWVRGRFGH